MSIKADQLKSNVSQKKAYGKEISGILGRIDDEIKVGHEQGKHLVTVSLPITFSIPYADNSDAQRIIYYKVLVSLIDRGFNVWLILKKNSTIFEITWLTDDEIKDIDVQIAVLAKHTKKDLTKLTLDDETDQNI